MSGLDVLRVVLSVWVVTVSGVFAGVTVAGFAVTDAGAEILLLASTVRLS